MVAAQEHDPGSQADSTDPSNKKSFLTPEEYELARDAILQIPGDLTGELPIHSPEEEELAREWAKEMGMESRDGRDLSPEPARITLTIPVEQVGREFEIRVRPNRKGWLDRVLKGDKK